MDELRLVRFEWRCGRMGSLMGLFVCTHQALQNLYEQQVCFGEVLGKHSEIGGKLSASDFEIVSTDQEFIAKITDIMVVDDQGTVNGYNPICYLDN